VVGGIVVVVVVGATVVVVVVGATVVVVVVGGTVVVVVVVDEVVDVVVVDVVDVVVDVVVVVVGGTVVVVVVGGTVVVVVEVDVVVVVGAAVVVVAEVTGIDRITSGGIGHVASAWSAPLLSDRCVVSEVSIRSIEPDAGAVASIEMVGVVSVTVAGSAALPVGNGPGCPNRIVFAPWVGAGVTTDSGVVSGFGCACHCEGLMSGWWFTFPVTSDL
jgi:hypothetical protein